MRVRCNTGWAVFILRRVAAGAMLFGCSTFAEPSTTQVIERLIQATDQWPEPARFHVQVPKDLFREVASDAGPLGEQALEICARFAWRTDGEEKRGQVTGTFRWEGQWPVTRDGITRLTLFPTDEVLLWLKRDAESVTPIQEGGAWVIYDPQGKPVLITGAVSTPVDRTDGWRSVTWSI